MAKKPETVFRERVLEDLKTLKNTWFESIQQVAIRGTPDIILCINSLFVAIELKKDGKTQPNRLQAYKLTRIRRRGGGKVFVAHPGNWVKVFQALKKMSLADS